jgi:hypothetical protein
MERRQSPCLFCNNEGSRKECLKDCQELENYQAYLDRIDYGNRPAFGSLTQTMVVGGGRRISPRSPAL